ncbi:hypothetical protein [Anaerotignum sp.]|uniref:hypothetical protein n=1 Tax=Anaerotignum sp. TaxID=2039241 RepID=UPI0028AA4BF8|nr:hypothetical protein [Anaerotignum sp.]
MLEKKAFQTVSFLAHDLERLTFENLQYHLSLGQSTSTGSGRNKEYTYKHGVRTPLGVIEETEWYQLMEQLIERSDEQWLLDALIQWEKERNYTRATSADLRKEALRLHSSRIFDKPKWVYYIPFNRQYRPDVLRRAHIVTVINECCNLPGEVTQEQIDCAYAGMVFCPHCGRWSTYIYSDKTCN